MKKYFWFIVVIFIFFFKLSFVEAEFISYSAHVQTIGWMNYVDNGKIMGTSGMGKRLEAFVLKNDNLDGDILYRSYVEGSGWQDYVTSGNISGTYGQGKRIEAIQIKLTDELNEKYDIYYRVHVQNIGWMGWTSNGKSAGTIGYDYRLEAIQIELIKNGDEIPSNVNNSYLEKELDVNVTSHIQSYGWINTVSSGNISGTVGKGKRLEAIKIQLNKLNMDGNILYRSYVEDDGWQDYVTSGNISGTYGQSKRIEAIQIKLTDELNEKYDIYYRVHVQNIGWMSWTSNDEAAGTIGYDYRIEAIQVKILKKDNNDIVQGDDYFREVKDYVKYSSHRQDYGWENYVYNGTTSGVVNSGKRLESIKINLNNKSADGDIEYSVHVQYDGWLNYVKNDQIAGTTGERKRMEAIKIRLTGDLATKYDVYYRAYVEDFGWLDWASNDQIAGSISISKRMEAIQIKLIEKDGEAPGKTEESYVDSIFRTIDGKKYYYEKGNKVTGFKTIKNVKYFFNSEGVLISSNVKKIIDVSVYQGDIDWNKVKNTDVDGAILRLGYGTSYTTDSPVLDKKFERNYNSSNSLNLLYGIYLYSYAIDKTSATLEANFVLDKLKKYNISKNIPVYYDLEENDWTTNLSKSNYHDIVSTFSNIIENEGYKVKVYSYKYWAENKLDSYVNDKLDWIAQYSDYCTYNGTYNGWQYTSSGKVNGISGNVDISVWK